MGCWVLLSSTYHWHRSLILIIELHLIIHSLIVMRRSINPGIIIGRLLIYTSTIATVVIVNRRLLHYLIVKCRLRLYYRHLGGSSKVIVHWLMLLYLRVHKHRLLELMLLLLLHGLLLLINDHRLYLLLLLKWILLRLRLLLHKLLLLLMLLILLMLLLSQLWCLQLKLFDALNDFNTMQPNLNPEVILQVLICDVIHERTINSQATYNQSS